MNGVIKPDDPLPWEAEVAVSQDQTNEEAVAAVADLRPQQRLQLLWRMKQQPNSVSIADETLTGGVQVDARSLVYAITTGDDAHRCVTAADNLDHMKEVLQRVAA